MKYNSSIKPGTLVFIPHGTFVMNGFDGHNTKRGHSVFVKAITNGVTLTPREITESAYYSGLYKEKGGDIQTLLRMKQEDPARFDREQIELFEPRIVWQGRHKAKFETSINNVVELKM